MENIDCQLSASSTLLNPSADDKENHPPPFTNFHTWDILYYFDAKFGTFEQYSKYLEQHLSDWQLDLHFQHFHSLYVQYSTFNDHIDSLGKILKTMEKSCDFIKGTIQHLAPLLHEKGLQDRIRSITNQTQPPSASLSEPFPDSSSNDSAILYASTSPEPKPVPPPWRHNEQEFCQTCKYPLKYDHILWAMGWDNYNGCTCRCPKPEKTPLIQNQLQFHKHWNPDPHTLVTSPPPSARNAMHFISNDTAWTSLAPTDWTAAPGHWLNKDFLSGDALRALYVVQYFGPHIYILSYHFPPSPFLCWLIFIWSLSMFHSVLRHSIRSFVY